MRDGRQSRIVAQHSAATDPRDASEAEVIDLATRRVMPAVSQRRPATDSAQIAIGVLVVALLGGLTYWSMGNSRQAGQSARYGPEATANAATASAQVAPQPAKSAAQPAIAPSPREAPIVLQPHKTAMPAANPYAAPTVVFDASALPSADPVGSAPAKAVAGLTGDGNEDFANRLGGVGGGTATATASFDPQTTIAQGTLIPAVLETAINTDVPGYARAVVSADVRSYDGSRVLVPRSSRLIGQYRSGMQAGQKRAYVIWLRLLRPDGVSVKLASPAVSFSGAAGIDGKVNTHFFERFGSAMLLSVIGGLSAVSSAGTAIITGGGQSAAAAAVGQTGKIGPTIKVRQGEPIRVFTSRDLDFSKVATE